MLCTGKLEADSTAGGQSSNLIHIQMTPLHNLDSYARRVKGASKLKTEGMEVAIYSGSCPLTCLACPQPSRTLQHQVCLPAAVLCVCLLLVALHSLPTISSTWQVFVQRRCTVHCRLSCFAPRFNTVHCSCVTALNQSVGSTALFTGFH